MFHALLACMGAAAAWASAAYPSVEAGVKSAYIYNFTKYTTWPKQAFPDPESPIRIGVLGEDPFGPVIDQTLGTRTSQQRKFEVRRAPGVKELMDCHAVFISRSEKVRLAAILEELRQAPVLTICDSEELFEQGVMIHLSMVKEAVRFEVNTGPVDRAGIKLGSGLLDAAIRIRSEGGRGAKRP